jgi:hypothetical protein
MRIMGTKSKGKWLLTSGGSFVLLVIVSFILLWVGDKLNASGMVLTRFMARMQAPLTAQFNYPTQVREQITVVMYDQQYLKATGSAWPISYQDHADWLLRLTADPGARPKAIMLDITFGQERADPTVASLKQALCTIQNDYKVPVFLAALPSPEDGRLRVRPGLEAGKSGQAPACFTLVGVDYVPDPLDGLAWSYQLSRHLTNAGWQSGPSRDDPRLPAYRSAAMAMAQDAAQLDLGPETVPMAMVWGYNSAPQTDRPEADLNCRVGEREYEKFIPGVLRQIWEDADRPPLCPYHQTLSMAQLGELPEHALAPYLRGRYVMVGAQVPGYNDFAVSPVHGIIPGIHMHAMALDNLLTYRGNYKLSAEWTLHPSWALLTPGLLSIFAVFLVHLAWNFCKGKFFSGTKSPDWWANRKRCKNCVLPLSRWQKVAGYVANALVWLLQMGLKTVVILVLIGWLQSRFRIGMLPVVELVTMTLVAEGLDYLDKIRSFISGDSGRHEK